MNKIMVILTVAVGCFGLPSCSGDATQPAGEPGPAGKNPTKIHNQQQPAETGPVAGKARLAIEKLLMVDDDLRVAERSTPGTVRLSPDAKYLVYISHQAEKISPDNGDGSPYELVERIAVRNVASGKDKRLPLPAFPAEFLFGVLPLCTFDPTGTKIVVPAGLDDNGDGFHSMEKEKMQAMVYDVLTGKTTRLGPSAGEVVPLFDRTGKGLIVSTLDGAKEKGNLYLVPVSRGKEKRLAVAGLPLAPCPVADVLLLVLEDSKLVLYDLKADKQTVELPVRVPDNILLNSYFPQWTADGRYLYYTDATEEEIDGRIETQTATRIWDRIAGKEVGAVERAFVLGAGPGKTTMLMINDAGSSHESVFLHDAASGKSRPVGDKSIGKIISVQGKFLVYAKLTPEGNPCYYAAEITLQPASPAEQTAASEKKVRDLLTELEAYYKEDVVRRRYLRAPASIVKDLAASDKAEVALPMLLQAIEDENWDVRYSAARGIGAMGPAGKEAVPALLKALEDQNGSVASEAANALAAVGPAATPSLIQLLQDETVSGKTRLFATRALGKIRPVGKQVISVLTEALKRPDKEWNRRAAEALGEIGPAAVGGLIEILDDGKPLAKYWAAEALKQMGPAAEPAIPALIRVLNTKEKAGPGYDLADQVATALVHIGPAGVSQIIRILGDENEDPEVRSKVAISLACLPDVEARSVDALIEAIKARDSDVRRSAIYSLGNMGPAAKAAVPALTKALKDEEAPVRYGSATALGRIGPAAKPALPALIQALKDGDPDVRSSAAFALGSIGLQTEEVVKALTEALKDEDQNVRQQAQEALKRIGAGPD